jgi:N-acetylneuraminate synthase
MDAHGVEPVGAEPAGNQRAYVLARVSEQHLGSLEQARRLVDAAVHCGCDGIRFDRRSPEESVVRGVLDRPLRKYPRHGWTVREVMQNLTLPLEALREVRAYCHGRIEFICAPYDLKSLEEVLQVTVDGLMIDATAANNWPLVDTVSRHPGKVLVATGLLQEHEIEELVDVFEGCDLTLLHSLTLQPFEANLAYLGLLRRLERFGRPIGYADNEPGVTMAMSALGLGATVIEKTLTLDKEADLPHGGGLSPSGMTRLVRTIRETDREPLTVIRTRMLAAQREAFDEEQVSLVAARDIAAGTVLTGDMLALKAPYRGLSPWRAADVLGKTTLYDLAQDDFITYGVIGA